jgi:hypothetical protein
MARARAAGIDPRHEFPTQYHSDVAEHPDTDPAGEEIHFHLELTPAQLKITHTALKSLLDDFGHEEPDVLRVIHDVLEKLPDEHSIRAISLDRELRREES